MVERKEYLDQLWAWKDERQIKVVTGIRRCGKSVLLEQYQQRLLANGVTPEQIISINFENLDYEPLKDYMRLYNYLKEGLGGPRCFRCRQGLCPSRRRPDRCRRTGWSPVSGALFAAVRAARRGEGNRLHPELRQVQLG